MTHERDHEHAHETSAAARDVDEVAPGRASRTERLHGAARPQPSGIVQRRARDDNGVAAEAGDAVASASTSSGAPLPTTLMRKFEESLGADLSGVRVHTGEASADAASAVGAKAYTVGQDIHFGAGHFDPASPAGEHLLAHEVAHTVQQTGAVQFKLEVSAPGDALEVEADRAADAMVSGAEASVTSASGLARKVMLDAEPKGLATSDFSLRDRVVCVQGRVEATQSLLGAVVDRSNEVLDDVRAQARVIVEAYKQGYQLYIDGVQKQLDANDKKLDKYKEDVERQEQTRRGLELCIKMATTGVELAGLLSD